MTILGGGKDLSEPEMGKITHGPRGVAEVLSDQLARGLAEDQVNLFEGLVLGFWHEQDLVDPPEHGDPPVEPEGQPGLGHGPLHVQEEVGDEPAAEEQVDVGGLHAVGPQVRREDLGRQDPRQAGVRAEEAIVQDDARQVQALGGDQGVRLVRDTHQDQADEEAREHHVGPESTAVLFHEQDARDGTEEQRPAPHE